MDGRKTYYTTGWLGSKNSQRELPSPKRNDFTIGTSYNSLERRELTLREQSFNLHPDLVGIWLEAIDLLEYGLFGNSPEIDDHAKAQAIRLQTLLCRLAAGTAKASLDMTMAGYYPGAFASVRLLIETSIAVQYLYTLPERSSEWGDDPGANPSSVRRKSPFAIKMKEQVVKASRPERNNERAQLVAQMTQKLYRQFELCSLGDHVTNETLALMASDPSGVDQTYPIFNEVATITLFHRGLYALRQAVFSIMLTREDVPFPPDNVNRYWPGGIGWIAQAKEWFQIAEAAIEQTGTWLRSKSPDVETLLEEQEPIGTDPRP